MMLMTVAVRTKVGVPTLDFLLPTDTISTVRYLVFASTLFLAPDHRLYHLLLSLSALRTYSTTLSESP